MRKILLIMCLSLSLIAFSRVRNRIVGSRTADFEFVVTEISEKPDDGLVRVKGNIVGRPHTSNRIDGVALVNGRDTIVANDIDGVDFERYFQWEDDGEIYLEIDFPAKNKQLPRVNKKSKIIFTTVLGEYIASPRK